MPAGLGRKAMINSNKQTIQVLNLVCPGLKGGAIVRIAFGLLAYFPSYTEQKKKLSKMCSGAHYNKSSIY